MRRPSASGDGMTLREPAAGHARIDGAAAGPGPATRG
jgi:hypothetical protein